MKVLSLFNGASLALLSLERAGATISKRNADVQDVW
jgi:hypothetical protein